MIKRLLVVALAGVSLAGCVSDNSLSGDVYSSSQAKQIQQVTYGTIVSTRAVQIQGGDDSNIIGALGGAGGAGGAGGVGGVPAQTGNLEIYQASVGFSAFERQGD